MTAEVVSVKQLSKCSDEEFDKNIKEMSLKTLMESISTLQKEMAREQENFNSLNGDLQTMKSRNSSQYKTISKEMVASQNRLTLLMNRSMKCFAQQNLQKGSTESGSVQLRRRNSAKGDQPSPTKSSTNVQRSKSMYIPPQPDPDPPATRIIKAGSSAYINHSSNASTKPYTPVIANGILNTRSPTTKSSTPRVKSQMQVLNIGSRPNNSVVKGDNSLSVVKGSNSVGKGDNSAIKADHSVMKTGNGVVKAGEIKSDKTDSVDSGSGTTNGEKEDFQVLPSVKQLAKNFGAFQRTTDNIVTPSNKPRLVKLRSSESMRIERPVSDGLMFSSKQKTDRVVNGNSEMTPTGRHVVSTVLKFDPSPRYKSTENLSSLSLTPSRPRTNSIPRSITVSSSAREATPTEDYQDIPLSNTRVTLRSSREALNSVENQPKQSINLKPSQNVTVVNSSTKTSKIEYNSFPGKNALMNEITARRKDSDADTTRIEVNESVLKSKPVQPAENSQPNAVKVTVSDNSTTKVFVSSGDKPAQTTNTSAVTTTAGGASKPQTYVPVIIKRNGTNGAPEKPARKSRPDSQNLVDKGRQPTPEQQKAEDEDVDEVQPHKINLRAWDPRRVLKDLYTVKLHEDNAEDISHQFIAMEGYMEKLPMNKKKSTLLKTWKRRFFKAVNGWLYYYESSNRDKPSDTVQLMGGHVDDMGNRILGIDDGRGKFLMVRCPTEREHGQWKLALESQTADNTRAVYIRPALKTNPHPQKKVVMIDLGSTSVRAGILGDQASLPSVFFPSVVAVNKSTDDLVVGIDAYKPEVRHQSVLSHPISPSNKVDKFNIDNKQMPAVFEKIFSDLGVNPSDYLVMLSTPQSLGDNLKKSLMDLLVGRLQVAGVCMVQQALLALYSYNATSGIIVDIGQRIEILPIFDGVLIEGGMARLPYGAQKIQDTLQLSLLANNYQFSTEVEHILVRYIMEKSCYVALDYKAELQRCKTNQSAVSSTVKIDTFDLPSEAYQKVSHDESRFKSPEGLFDTDMWEMDFPKLHKLVYQAIQTCPMDSRRRMFRAVYLSGGVTTIPGFPERLHEELVKLAPPSVPVEVHVSPNRYHAAYIGACAVAQMSEFEHMCISREEWHSTGVKALRKWNAPSS